MKNLAPTVLMFLFVIGNLFAQQEKGIVGKDNWLDNWTEFKPKLIDYGEPTQILVGSITEDTKLSKRYKYLLSGSVFVVDSVTLTIEPGTVIIGDYDTKASLTIAKGATIIADGLSTDPIVFTSNRSVKKAGDWGGLIILGDAPTNKYGNGSVASFYSQPSAATYQYSNYGGINAKSNSGILRYVRIEYAGKRIKGAGYFNGLLLAGVGNETVLENIMVSYSAGDSYKVLGGDINLKKTVSYKTSGNDFKFNYGAQCNISNSLAIRSPYISSSSGSRSLQINSYNRNKKEEIDFTKKGTSVNVENMTLLTSSDDINADIQKGLIKSAVFIGHNASLNMNKSVISGFNPAVLFEDKVKVNQENLEKIKFTDMFFNNCKGNIFVENNSNNEDLENWYGNSSFFNVYSKSSNDETFIDAKHPRRPDFRLRINKIIASNEIGGIRRVD